MSLGIQCKIGETPRERYDTTENTVRRGKRGRNGNSQEVTSIRNKQICSEKEERVKQCPCEHSWVPQKTPCRGPTVSHRAGSCARASTRRLTAGAQQETLRTLSAYSPSFA